MNYTNHTNFIDDALNATKPAVVVFYEGDIETIKSFKDAVLKYKELVPALPLFFYDTAIEANQELAENLGVTKTPTLMVFKNKGIHRWLEPKAGTITAASAVKFIGSPALYGVAQQEAPDVLEQIKAKPKKLKLK